MKDLDFLSRTFAHLDWMYSIYSCRLTNNNSPVTFFSLHHAVNRAMVLFIYIYIKLSYCAECSFQLSINIFSLQISHFRCKSVIHILPFFLLNLIPFSFQCIFAFACNSFSTTFPKSTYSLLPLFDSLNAFCKTFFLFQTFPLCFPQVHLCR